MVIDDLHSLTDLYNDLYKGYRVIPFSDFSKTISYETTEQFKKRVNDNLSDVELVSKLDETFEAFCKILANQADTIACKRYSFMPIITSIEHEKERNKLAKKFNDYPKTLYTMHNRLIQFRFLWKALLELYTKKEEFEGISLEIIHEESNSNVSYANFYNLIKSIALADNYNEFLDSSIPAKDKFLNPDDLSHLTEGQRDDYYKGCRIGHLHAILYSDKITVVFHNAVAHTKNLALECISETKEVLCTLSAIYSYILDDDVSLDDEIQKYKKLLELDTYLY